MARKAKLGYHDEYLRILQDLKGDEAGRAAANEYLAVAYPHGEADAYRGAINPILLNEEQYGILAEAATTLSSIMEKVMSKYHRDRSFRSLFGFDPVIEKMTLVPSGCNAAVPLARADLNFDPKTKNFKICGIATGGVDGMAVSSEAARAIMRTNAYREFANLHEIEFFDTVTSCADQLLYTYRTWVNVEVGHNHPKNPSMAIVDIEDSPRADETEVFIKHLHGEGCYAHAATFSELKIKQVDGREQLVDSHGPVTCVWLRATADEAARDESNGVQALFSATRRGLVCTIGGYRSWPCCARSFMEVLRTRDCRMLLSRPENEFVEAHFAETHMITPYTDLSDFYDQENWVIKTTDGRDPRGIIAGASLSKAEWRKRLVKGIMPRDAVQEYLPTAAIKVISGGGDPVDMNIMLGLYIFGGKLCGIRASCGTGYTIADWDDQVELACGVVH